ncbi:uncharacterized protein LOC114131742 isoform X2 [Aphis gossypii]|uniref:uncharacterized protein LOC114131742 isoform X2 n=1 Tax=Aphis gossypii TaxID=80765 RepID=UPI002158E8BD|nr:uncharacterized protein LOC114131742 isoform X2 [Aphis gossypii]
MFASMYKTLLNKSKINAKDKSIVEESETVKITSNDIKHLLNELNEIKDNSDNCSDVYDITDAIELLSIVDNHPGHLNDNTLVEYSDDTKNEVRSIGKNQIGVATIKDRDMKKIVNKMNHLQCLFTWNVKSKNKNLILHIQNKYGEYNLNISSSEFTLERFIGNLIIFHELFHHGEPESAQIKILEIGKWLEELDKGTDEFYLSIKSGIQHIMKATFIHMLFAMNLTEECKWLLDDIVLLSIMHSKSRASIHAIHAAVLIEYGNPSYLKKACETAKKACALDPRTSHWFYIHSLALTAQRQFLLPYKSVPAKNEINAINQANILCNGINELFKYHEIVLFRETTVRSFYKNKNIKSFIKIINIIKTLINMDPKDPLLVINCARILMTLPIMVCDFNLGKQYLTKAFEMAPNDPTVLQAIENTVQAFKDIKHSSLFGSKPFNLSELICNEIRLATDLSGTSSDDMLYYFKTLPKIVETCNLKIQDVDSSMKSKLIVDSNVNSIFSNASVQSETESSDSESVKFKNLTEEILERNSKLYPYIQQLYQKILSNTHSRFNSPNVSSRDFNNYFNQNYANFSSQLQWNPFQDTPPFLSLIPQINPQNPKPKQKKNLKEK